MRTLFRIQQPQSWLFLAVVLVPLSGGCKSPDQLMPTPNVYVRGDRELFANVPVAHQHNRAEVLYLTDRKPEKNDDALKQQYGYKRSRSLAYGVGTVEFGKDVSWDDLVRASSVSKRSVSLPLKVTKVQELGRFPQTPRNLIELPPGTGSAAAPGPSTQPGDDEREADRRFHAELSSRLADSPVKDVYIFVHGYNNTFDDSVKTVAQLWHFFGRQGVAVAYSWPAGSSGLLRGYTYDRESSEFTVYHFKRTLRRIASCPDVGKVHVIAHSRGTDVAATALRELHLEFSGGGQITREALKLQTLVLAAPDMDLDVVIQRSMTARIGQVPERFAMYVSPKDKALELSNWLFSGAVRLGQLKSSMFTPEELASLRGSRTVQIIDARISQGGSFGHGYFHASPAVSSDLVLLVRYQCAPGAENGRPLRAHESGFWVIDDSYPAPEALPPAGKVSP